MKAIPAPESDPDYGVPWHYGDPHREERALLEGEAAVDLSHWGVLTVTGVDRLSWLHSLTTAHMDSMAAGDSLVALILSPHGHVEQELHVIDDGETTWLITPPHTATTLTDYLNSMRFMLRVEVTDRSEDFAVVWEPTREVDPDHPSWLTPADFAGTGATDPGADLGSSTHKYVSGRPSFFLGRQVIIARDELESRLARFPRQAGTWAWHAIRTAAAVPLLGWESDHKTLPHEIGWIGPGVHLKKGCYRGQETVARVHNLGKPPRRLVLLHLDGSEHELPSHGDLVVTTGGKTIGFIGTAARHYELGPIATAVIKRSVPVAETLLVHHGDTVISATQEIVVSPN